MDLELLRTFLELNRSRHFGRTADTLHLTQAAVSSRIKKLEDSLGVLLFERGKRGQIRLTAAGTRLIRHAEFQLSAWHTAEQDVSRASASQQLVIGGSLRLWDVILQDWLIQLRLMNDQMAIFAESHTPEILIRRLIDDSLDVGIMLETPNLDNLQIKPVVTLRFMCVSNRPNITAHEALASRYVYVDWGLAHNLEHGRAFPDAPPAMTNVSHAKMALGYILKIGGSAYLPEQMVAPLLATGSLHIVQDAPVFKREAHAVYRVRTSKLPLIEHCLTLLSEPQNR